MRSLVSAPSVGLLLFDEPSASLDPAAEHGKTFCYSLFLVNNLVFVQTYFNACATYAVTRLWFSHRTGLET
jgi:hypothetical protein